MRFTLTLLVCIALAGCSSSNQPDVDLPWAGGGLVSFGVDPQQPAERGHSAFDGNVHTYQVVATVPSATDTPTSTNPDPVLPDSLVWSVDGAYLNKEAYPDIRGSILLTTKRAGETIVKVTGKRLSGITDEDRVPLTISQAKPTEWTQGDARYEVGAMTDLGPGSLSNIDAGTSTCDLPLDAIPTSTACASCHGETSSVAAELTPAQTAVYSDEDLTQIFTAGSRPLGYTFKSDLLKTVRMPDCVFKAFHAWDIDDAAKHGLVWKLRSIKPRSY